MVLVYQGGKKKTFNKAMEWLQESVYPWAFHSFKGSDVIPVHNEIAVPAKEPWFQENAEDYVCEFSESHPLPLSYDPTDAINL